MDFVEFLRRRGDVAAAYCNGDAAPLDTITPHRGAASFLPPSGGHISGAETVAARYHADAAAFAPGNETWLEVVQSSASDGVGFWTGYQHFKGRLGGKEMTLKLRVTEVFRHDMDGWRMIHRHADAAGQ